MFLKSHDYFDHWGDLRAEEAVLLHIPRILSMSLWRPGSTHLLSECVCARARVRACVCVISQGKIPGNSPPRPGISHGEDRQWDTLILQLSYHDPGHGEGRQWDSFSLPLSYYDGIYREKNSLQWLQIPSSILSSIIIDSSEGGSHLRSWLFDKQTCL